MPFPTSTDTQPAQPSKRGRPPRALCKRGHISERYANGTCKECQRAASRAQYDNNPEKYREYTRQYFVKNPLQQLLNSARERARKGGYPCTITLKDIVVPEFCPLLGIKLKRNPGGIVQPSSPSIDKIRPELGYVPGNVWVISHRANSIKSNATLRELQTLVDNLAKTYVIFPWDGR